MKNSIYSTKISNNGQFLKSKIVKNLEYANKFFKYNGRIKSNRLIIRYEHKK
jgi:hypothetical protein